LKSDFIITAACFVDHKGLIQGQGYIVQSFKTFKGENGKEIRLIKLKNPFKMSENVKQKENWLGKYGHKDQFWNENNLKSIGGMSDDEFVMGVEDFRDSFKSYTITYLRENWKNSFIEKKNAVNKKTYKFNFSITEEQLGDEDSLTFR